MNAVATSAPVSPASGFPAAVAVALTGTFVANLTAQFFSANLADIQGGIGASADEASWVGTIYTAASIAGIIVSPVLLKTLGLRRYFVSAAALFAFSAALAALATSLPWLLIVRTLQGLAGGAFGPIAFAAVFMMCKGPRLPWGLSLLAFVLVVSASAGPVLSGPVEASLGWRGLVLVQVWTITLLALAALRWMPAAPVNPDGLHTDWTAIALLVLAIGALLVAVSQGARRFWLNDTIVGGALSLAVGGAIGFAIVHRYAPTRILHADKLLDPRFGVPIALNLFFRASFAVTVYVIPLLLAQTQGYRPLQVSQTLLWNLLPQLVAFPLSWRLAQRVDHRLPLAAGLALIAVGTWLMASSTDLVAGEQLRAGLVLIGVGQILFIVPTLLIGALSLKPEHGPTATIAFNVTTLGGTTLGIGLLSHFTIEREKFHSSVLVDHVSWLQPEVADRLADSANTWASRIGDGTSTPVALAQLGGAVRREAWLLAIDDSFALMAALVVVLILGVALLGPSPPPPRTESGALS